MYYLTGTLDRYGTRISADRQVLEIFDLLMGAVLVIYDDPPEFYRSIFDLHMYLAYVVSVAGTDGVVINSKIYVLLAQLVPILGRGSRCTCDNKYQ